MRFIIALLCVFPFLAAANDLSAITDKGEVIGHYNEAGAREWKGIPFAQPPGLKSVTTYFIFCFILLHLTVYLFK